MSTRHTLADRSPHLAADIDNLRDDIDYYITDNNDPDFMMDDEMYEALGMDTAMPPPTPVEETPKKSSALGGAGGASKSAKGGSKKGTLAALPGASLLGSNASIAVCVPQRVLQVQMT